MSTDNTARPKKTRKPSETQVILNINQILVPTPRPHTYFTLSWQFPNHRHLCARYATFANVKRTAEKLVDHIQSGGIKIALPEGFQDKPKRPAGPKV